MVTSTSETAPAGQVWDLEASFSKPGAAATCLLSARLSTAHLLYVDALSQVWKFALRTGV